MKTIEVVSAVILKNNSVFATQRGYGEWKDWWEFPGGKMEAGETAQQALVREIREELDAEIIVGEIIRTIEWDYPAFHLTMHCFWCELTSESLHLNEHEAAAWLDQKSLRSVQWLPADMGLLDEIESAISIKPYNDIRNVKYPFKSTHPRMSIQNRAAQFSPFAALSGYDALIGETIRLTDNKVELDETERAELDMTMRAILSNPDKTVTIVYFLQDSRKAGGAYLSVSGHIKKIEQANRTIVMDDKTIIPLEDVISLRIEE